jgi:polyhydroxybutyrate depolymerase
MAWLRHARRGGAPAALVAMVIACGSSTSGGGGVGPGDDQGDGGPGDDGPTAGDDGATKPDSPTPPPPPPPPEVKATNESISVNGETRMYVLAVPLDYTAGSGKSYPLVLDFHGQPGSGAQMRAYMPYEAVSHKDAIIAYPDGKNGEWDLYTVAAQNADFAFIRALVDDLATKYTIDKTRVLATGYSNGGFFLNEVACHYQGLFKAIASHAGGAPDEEFDPAAQKDGQGYWICPGGPIPAIVFHGTADNVVPTAGGDFDAQYWAHVNGCQDTRSPTTPSPCVKHDGCPAKLPVEWCFIPGLGHVVWNQGDATSWAFFNAL